MQAREGGGFRPTDAYLPPNSVDLHPLPVMDGSPVRVYSFAIFL